MVATCDICSWTTFQHLVLPLAVLFTNLFGDIEFEDGGQYFSRLDLSLLTLFVMMTMEWAGVARQCMDQM